MNRLITLALLILITSCSTDKKTSSTTTTFIGSYRIIDQLIPYPYLLQQKKDSIYLFNNKGILTDKIKNTEIIVGNTLNFNQKHFRILDKQQDNFFAFDLLDTLNFNTYKDGANFNKIEPSKEIDIQKLKKEIKDIIWTYDLVEDENSNPNKDLDIKQLLQFENDSLHIITNYYYEGIKTVSEYESKAYSIFELDGLYFLSYEKEQNNPQPIFQILDYDGEKITLKDYSSRESKEINFVKNTKKKEDYPKLIDAATKYSNCFDGYQGEYHFMDDVTFNKGNEYIIEQVSFNAPVQDIKSGYIIVHFTINCNGEAGRFGLIQMDRAYKKTSFSKEMVSHLVKKVSELNDFPSSYSQLDWLNYKDVHAFLMFKLEKGKIVDLCP